MRLTRKIDFWIEKNLNVLFVGRHGTGKTSIITSAFERAGLRWKYFSASTMDPFLDFCGLPRERKLEDGTSYIELVRPLEFAKDEIDAIYFDEFSRSHKKVRNAVMELIQFKSINGHKFNNLKMVWAAINPDDDTELEYDVEKLDPAQKDRFHIVCSMPYHPDLPYFQEKYGDLAAPAIEWWENLPDAMKNEVSPRRLDYALDLYRMGGSLRDCLPAKSNVAKLGACLENGAVNKQLEEIYESKDAQTAEAFLSNDNNYQAVVSSIVSHNKYTEYFLKYLPIEKLATLATKESSVLNYICDNHKKEDKYVGVISDFIRSGSKFGNKVIQRLPASVANQKSALAKSILIDSIRNAKRGPTINGRGRRIRGDRSVLKFAKRLVKFHECSLNDAIDIGNVCNKMCATTPLLQFVFKKISDEADTKTFEAICGHYGWKKIFKRYSCDANFKFKRNLRKRRYLYTGVKKKKRKK